MKGLVWGNRVKQVDFNKHSKFFALKSLLKRFNHNSNESYRRIQ